MPSDPSLASLIAQQAATQGVPPSIALAVAQHESSLNPNAVGAAGEIGLFQIMPTTGAGLGVSNPDDLFDPTTNTTAGISYLAQLYQQYGNWTAALSAYNSGSPTRSIGYANTVLGIASNLAPTTDAAVSDSSDAGSSTILGLDPNVLIVAGVVAVLGVFWWMES